MNFSWKKEHTLHSLYISASFSNITPLGRCFGNNLLNRINNSRSNSSSSRFQNNGNKKRTEQQHKMEYNYYVRIKFRVIAFCFVFTWHDMHSWHYGIHFKFWFVFFFSLSLVWFSFSAVHRSFSSFGSFFKLCLANARAPFAWMKINSVLCIRPFGISSRFKTKTRNRCSSPSSGFSSISLRLTFLFAHFRHIYIFNVFFSLFFSSTLKHHKNDAILPNWFEHF